MLWWAKGEIPMVTGRQKTMGHLGHKWVKQAKLGASEVFHPDRKPPWKSGDPSTLPKKK